MEYGPYISESITRKVSLVVQVIDDFTGKPILGSNVRVYIEDGPKAIKKDDGYHVFVNLDQPSVTICVEGGQFNTRSADCDLTAGVDRYTFLKLRMVPNRLYPIPKNTTCIEGKASAGSQIRIFCSDTAGSYKLLYDYKQENTEDGRRISIFHPDDMDMEGKLLSITDDKGKNQEFLRIAGIADRESKEYFLEKPLLVSYKKIGTSLYPVYETTADQNGYFFLPIANTFKDRYQYVCEAVGDKTISLNADLISGKVNEIDLR